MRTKKQISWVILVTLCYQKERSHSLPALTCMVLSPPCIIPSNNHLTQKKKIKKWRGVGERDDKGNEQWTLFCYFNLQEVRQVLEPVQRQWEKEWSDAALSAALTLQLTALQSHKASLIRATLEGILWVWQSKTFWKSGVIYIHTPRARAANHGYLILN